MQIRVEHTQHPKAKPADKTKLGFGRTSTDHMSIMDYTNGEGWHDPRIVPYAPLDLEPFAICLHYGQSVLEGMKACRTDDNRILPFRPDRNMAHLNVSNERLCIPQINEQSTVEIIKKLVFVDRDWVPSAPGISSYIHPFIIGVDPVVDVHLAHHLMSIIIRSPVGAYYPEGLSLVKIYVEDGYVRAVKSGMSSVKTAGSYVAPLKAQDEAEKQNYTQVLRLDGVEHKYIEEVGTVNVFFQIGNGVVTPTLQSPILFGVTRMSAINILKSWSLNIIERHLSIQEMADAAKEGDLRGAFGIGTAAVISPTGHLRRGDVIMEFNDDKIGPLSQRCLLYTSPSPRDEPWPYR